MRTFLFCVLTSALSAAVTSLAISWYTETEISYLEAAPIEPIVPPFGVVMDSAEGPGLMEYVTD